VTDSLGNPPISPVVRRIASGLLEQLGELTDTLVESIRVSEAIYRENSVVPADDLRRSCEDHLSYVLGEMAGLHRDTRTARQVGRRRAEQGVPLPALLHAYRAGARHIATQLLEQAPEVFTSEVVLGTVGTAWEMLEDYSEAVTASYLEAVGERTRRDAQARSAMAGALLAGELGDGPLLVEGALTLQLPLRGQFLVLTVAEATSGIEDRLRRAGVGVAAWHGEVGATTGVVLLPPRVRPAALESALAAKSGERIGVSAGFGELAFTPLAARQARLALSCAGPGDCIRYDVAPVPIMLASSPDAANNLLRSVLGPVLDLPERERGLLLETMRVWFATGGSVAKAAAALYVHRNTVGYRATQIENLTGRRLTDTAEAAELYLALEARRILALTEVG
jgi:hypothetical protein